MPDHPNIETAPARLPASSGANSRWRQSLNQHAYILPSMVLSLLVCFWFVTWGDWNLFPSELNSSFYDAHARSILHGHLDVPPAAIGIEAFIRDGKTYGYFGITPALLRLPLILIFPKDEFPWSRLVILCGCAANLALAYRLLLFLQDGGAVQTSRRVANSLFILCAGIGSTNVFLAARSFVYHEAIMAGATFALAAAVALLSYVKKPTLWRLGMVGLLTYLAFLSRPTAGAGAVLMLGMVAVLLVFRPTLLGLPKADRARTVWPRRHAILAALFVTLTIGTYVGVNYAKFRTFDGIPLRYYALLQRDPPRVRRLGGSLMHAGNIPTLAASYLAAGPELRLHFPWIFMVDRPKVVGRPVIDLYEPYAAISVSTPALCLLALIGSAAIVRGRGEKCRLLRLPAVALLLGGGVVLMTVGISQRYLHDFYPFMVITGAVGADLIGGRQRPSVLLPVFAMLTLWSIGVNCAFAIEFQREGEMTVSVEKHREFIRVRRTVDRFLHCPLQTPAEE